jgi:hypothetical protein
MPVGKRTARAPRYTRKSYFVSEEAVSRARRALGARTDAEAVRLAVDRVIESEEFWRFMAATRGRLEPGSFERP